MSSLPGHRHRILAPTNVLGEGDVLAMERANAAVRSGAHGLVEVSVDIRGGRRTGWTTSGEVTLDANAPGDVVRYSLRTWAGSILAAVDLWIEQQNAGAPISAFLEVQRASSADGETLEAVASDDAEIALRQFRRRSIGLIDVNADRPLGWPIPSGPLAIPTLRLVAGDGGDSLSGIVLWFQRRPA